MAKESINNSANECNEVGMSDANIENFVRTRSERMGRTLIWE